MPRYAILEHDHPTPHWDFLLESGAVLLAWRLSAPPGGDAVEGEQSFDHRTLYLDYEGPVGGGRGRVKRWDAGTFEWEMRGPDQLVVCLRGDRLRCAFRLERIDGARWRGSVAAEEVS